MAHRFSTTHGHGSPLPAHRHQEAYVALVDCGTYREFSADGAYECGPGMAVVHPVFHFHGNRFLDARVAVINVVVPALWEYRVVRLSRRQWDQARQSDDPLELAELIDGGEPVPERDLPFVVGEAARLLREDPGRRIHDVAATVHCTPEHLARSFRRHVGLSPSAFRAEHRLRRALVDLVDEVPASTVAHRWGYADQSHLCRSVKAATGRTIRRLERSGFFKTDSNGGV